ncbi:MAG: hypothetical protein ACI8R9_002795 [Paraglaciecola sp.]|jgi:hypothetical protein
MLLVILLAIVVAALFIYSLTKDTGKNTRYARKGANVEAQESTVEPTSMVELSSENSR